jgi:hypothetical protein
LELQERNEQIIQQNQEEKCEVVSENIPRKTMEQVGVEEQKGDDDKEEEKEKEQVEAVKGFFGLIKTIQTKVQEKI